MYDEHEMTINQYTDLLLLPAGREGPFVIGAAVGITSELNFGSAPCDQLSSGGEKRHRKRMLTDEGLPFASHPVHNSEGSCAQRRGGLLTWDHEQSQVGLKSELSAEQRYNLASVASIASAVPASRIYVQFELSGLGRRYVKEPTSIKQAESNSPGVESNGEP
ncbi:hypothetical protein B0H19DRAFT_1058712 [Mycena capillaripes]|nr:hypothetical protein B0H19DRAFT_1058712 [Mycena capillaripes]